MERCAAETYAKTLQTVQALLWRMALLIQHINEAERQRIYHGLALRPETLAYRKCRPCAHIEGDYSVLLYHICCT